MLLARLQAEPVGGVAVGILRHADEAAGQLALEAGAHGHVAGVRSAEAHRNAEALAGADGDVGAELTRAGDQGEREEVGRDDGEAALRLRGRDDRCGVPDVARGARVLDEDAEVLAELGETGLVEARERSTTSSMPTASAREASSASVCGKASASTMKRGLFDFDPRRASSMPSTTAVPSSSIDAFAVSSPVRSVTMVWKLMSASRRPCEISGWYGVYAVYQLGFSSTLRLITAGVIVP